MKAERFGAYARLFAIIGNRMMKSYQTDLLWDISRLSLLDDGCGFKILLRETATSFIDEREIESGEYEELLNADLFDVEFSFDGERGVEVRRLRENEYYDYDFACRRMRQHLEDLSFDEFDIVFID